MRWTLQRWWAELVWLSGVYWCWFTHRTVPVHRTPGWEYWQCETCGRRSAFDRGVAFLHDHQDRAWLAGETEDIDEPPRESVWL